jgi:hypothetical protein
MRLGFARTAAPKGDAAAALRLPLRRVQDPDTLNSPGWALAHHGLRLRLAVLATPRLYAINQGNCPTCCETLPGHTPSSVCT